MINPEKTSSSVIVSVSINPQTEEGVSFSAPVKTGTDTSNQPDAKHKKLEKLEVQYLRTEQRVNGISVATLTLSVHDNPLQNLSSCPELEYCRPGNKLNIIYSDGVHFTGLITGNHLTLSAHKQEITLTLKHELVRLENVVRSQVFTKKTDAQIITALCGPVSLENKAEYYTKSEHEQRIQYRCSDWQMLRYSLDGCGVWLIAEPSGVRITTPELNLATAHHLDAEDRDPGIENAEWHFSSVDIPAGLKVSSWDIQRQEMTTKHGQPLILGSGALDPHAGQRLNSHTWALGYGTSSSETALGLQANSVLQSLRLKRVQGNFTVEGGKRKYRLGDTLSVSGFGEECNGSGIITAIVHTVTPSRWTTTVTVGDGGQPLVRSSLCDTSVLLPGIVEPYQPDKLDRIRVRLDMLPNAQASGQEKGEPIWARFAMPYASEKKSFLCYPEPGDEVVLGFFEGCPDYPVIVGAMHNPKKQPAENPGSNIKGWDFGSMKMQLDLDTRKRMITLEAPKIDLKK